MIKHSIILLISLSLYSFLELNGQSKMPIERCLTQNQFDDRYASYSPNAEWIAFESNRGGDWAIYIMDTKGENVQKLTSGNKDNRRPSWHPNGNKILFESNRSGNQELYEVNVKNKKEKKLETNIRSGELLFAFYSPNGKFIAASLKESDDKSNIVLMKKNGKLIRKLTSNTYRNNYPRWSKDGNEIIFFSRKDTENKDDEIYRLNLKTNKEFRLTKWHKHNFCPSWSNDRQRIVYVTSMEGSRPEIYIMDADGKNEMRITNNDLGETLPNWHPDDNKILITAYRNGNYEICELEL